VNQKPEIDRESYRAMLSELVTEFKKTCDFMGVEEEHRAPEYIGDMTDVFGEIIERYVAVRGTPS